MSYSRNGFTPSREPDVGFIRNLPVNALAKEVAKGDAVTWLAGAALAASAATNPTKAGLGVVLAVYTTAGRPLTFQNTKYIASGGVGRADICLDPNQLYTVQCVTSVGGTNLFTNVMLDVSAGNATTGLSGQAVDLVASASTGELFKIIGLAPFETINTPYGQTVIGGGANNGVEVAWNFHFLRSPTAAI